MARLPSPYIKPPSTSQPLNLSTFQPFNLSTLNMSTRQLVNPTTQQFNNLDHEALHFTLVLRHPTHHHRHCPSPLSRLSSSHFGHHIRSLTGTPASKRHPSIPRNPVMTQSFASSSNARCASDVQNPSPVTHEQVEQPKCDRILKRCPKVQMTLHSLIIPLLSR